MGTRVKGSVTVEAAIVLPVFLCIIISIIFLIKVVYTHEIIQHAIDETANEMASASYLYHVSGMQGIHDSLRDGMDSRAEVFKNYTDAFLESYKDLNNIISAVDAAEEIAENPVRELESLAFSLAEGQFDDIKTQLFLPLLKLYIKKYLVTAESKDLDVRLQKLNIAGGYEGLDFSRSGFFEDENNDIDIVVRYKIDLPVPVRLLPSLTIMQRAAVKAWLGGDEENGSALQNGNGEDIWFLDNFQRGRKIRDIFGANLPLSFPVIAKFESGRATMIKSMDLTAETYQDALSVSKTVEEYIDKLYKFKGQEEPWGSKGIVIPGNDISSRELLLIIPGNPVEPGVDAALEACRMKALSKGVELKIVRYGYKGQEKK